MMMTTNLRVTTFYVSEELGLAVAWHGGATFNVHQIDNDNDDGYAAGCAIGLEVDVFTRHGDDRGNAPTAAQAADFARGWLEGVYDDQRDEDDDDPHGDGDPDGEVTWWYGHDVPGMPSTED